MKDKISLLKGPMNDGLFLDVPDGISITNERKFREMLKYRILSGNDMLRSHLDIWLHPKQLMYKKQLNMILLNAVGKK